MTAYTIGKDLFQTFEWFSIYLFKTMPKNDAMLLSRFGKAAAESVFVVSFHPWKPPPIV